MEILAVWQVKDSFYVRTREEAFGRVFERTRKMDQSRDKQGAMIRAAVAKWRESLPADPVKRAVERLNQLHAEMMRRRALVRDAARVFVEDESKRWVLGDAILGEEQAEDKDLLEAIEIALPDAYASWVAR